jgi:hypothetical protein
MTRTKTIYSILLAIVLLATQIIAVSAAPAKQDTTPITGTVEDITLDTTTEVTTVLVTLTDNITGATQTVRLSLEDATNLGLVTTEGTANSDAIGTSTTIDPALAIPDAPETTTPEEAQHPVGSALSNFFSDLLGVDYQTIMDFHDNGVGFGVIAQALWMTKALGGDSDTFAAILDAKQNNDYSAITLPDGSTPKNWGQFRKAVMSDRDKSKENLGAIMSGRAENGQNDETQVNTQNNGNGNGNGPNQDNNNNGNGPDKGKSNNGKGPDKDKGNNGNGNSHNKGKGKNK